MNYRETWDKANWRDVKGVKLVDEDTPSYVSIIGTSILIVVCVILAMFI
jgi:hypothetical protein